MTYSSSRQYVTNESSIDEVTDSELAELAAGLSASPPRVPSKYFYNARGSALFDQICELPEYYVTRAERRLLERIAGEVIDLQGPVHLAELGSGMARKTDVLLEAMLASNDDVRYSPLDISVSALEQSAKALKRNFPRLDIEGFECDFTRDLGGFRSRGRCLLAFLGSSIGNFAPDDGVRLLRRLRSFLRPGDGFLMGVDLVKPVEVLEDAYNDKHGVTAAFNRNILRAVNDRFGSDFQPETFEHAAFFNESESRIEMHLAAARAQTVDLGLIGGELELEAGDRILTEYSYKYTRKRASKLLNSAGFKLKKWYSSSDDYVALALAGIAGDRERRLRSVD